MQRPMKPLFLILFFFFTGAAYAETMATSKVVQDCLAKAASLHHVDYKLLKAIAKVESGMNPNAINKNSNGSFDRGLMQINDVWLPKLANFGIKTNDLFEPCNSAYVGAWILSHSIKTHGPTWRAIGAYNSPTEKNRQIYADKVRRALAEQ